MSNFRSESVPCKSLCIPVTRCCLFLPLPVAIRALIVDAGQSMPYFVAKTMDGDRLTNDSAKATVLLIEFWATWC